MSAGVPAAAGLQLTPADLELIAEALDSHLYWQVCQDLSRRRDGYVMEPHPEDERAVIALAAKIEAIKLHL